MEQVLVRNHDFLDWDTVRQCEAVQELSRFTPGNSGDFESPESLLSRAGEVANGMKAVIQQSCLIPKENK